MRHFAYKIINKINMFFLFLLAKRLSLQRAIDGVISRRTQKKRPSERWAL
jgi:hypothetical protein